MMYMMSQTGRCYWNETQRTTFNQPKTNWPSEKSTYDLYLSHLPNKKEQ